MELYRIDYTLLGMVSPNCMKVLPIAQNDEAEKKTQKVISKKCRHIDICST